MITALVIATTIVMMTSMLGAVIVVMATVSSIVVAFLRWAPTAVSITTTIAVTLAIPVAIISLIALLALMPGRLATRVRLDKEWTGREYRLHAVRIVSATILTTVPMTVLSIGNTADGGSHQNRDQADYLFEIAHGSAPNLGNLPETLGYLKYGSHTRPIPLNRP